MGFYPSMNLPSEFPTVQFPNNVIEESLTHWHNTLVGYFIDKRLSFQAVQSIVRKMWQHFGLLEVLSHNSGCFFILFH